MQLHSLVTSALEGDGWSRRRRGSFTTEDNVPGAIVHEGVWASTPVWRDVEKKKSLDPTGIQTRNRQCRSELLCVLRHNVPQMTIKRCISYQQEKANNRTLEDIWTYNSHRIRNSADRRKDETK